MIGGHGEPAPETGICLLGVDPGLECTGYALLVDFPDRREPCVLEAGVIRLDRRAPLAARLVRLQADLEALLAQRPPTAVACEELYAHYRHPRTAILMAHARGVILAAVARRGVPILPVAATQVKKVLTGSGRASKRQVQRAIAATLGLPGIPEPADVADALAIALCGLRLYQDRERLSAAGGGP